MDMVEKPAHYNFGKRLDTDGRSYWEPVKIQDRRAPYALFWACNLSVIKYLIRAERKNNYAQDIKKAIWYLKEMNRLELPIEMEDQVANHKAALEIQQACQELDVHPDLTRALFEFSLTNFTDAVVILENHLLSKNEG